MTDDELIDALLANNTDGVEKLFWRIKRQLNGRLVADATVALAMVIASMRLDAEDEADLLLDSLLAMMRRIEASYPVLERLP